MRYRERFLPEVPYAKRVAPVQKETFLDDGDRLRKGQWKECSHTKTRVLECISQGDIRRIAFNPYNWIVTSIQTGPNDAFTPFSYSNLGGWYQEPAEEPEVSLPPVDLQSLRAERSRSSSNLAETIATFRDTLGLFSRPWHFANHLKEVSAYNRGGTLRNAKDAIDRASDTWLQGTYGYLPFISDLVELSRIARNPRDVLRRAMKPETQRMTQMSSGESTSKPFADTSFGKCYMRTTTTVSLKRVVVIRWKTNPSFASMSVANQLATYLGLNDMGRLAWELTPYSFVIDWFTNLGRKCANTDALNGHYTVDVGDVLTGTETKRDVSLSGYCPVPFKDEGDWKYRIQVDRFPFCRYETTTYSRSVLQDPSSIDGVFLTNGLSAYRTATGVALLTGPLTSFYKFLTKGK